MIFIDCLVCVFCLFDFDWVNMVFDYLLVLLLFIEFLCGVVGCSFYLGGFMVCEVDWLVVVLDDFEVVFDGLIDGFGVFFMLDIV